MNDVFSLFERFVRNAKHVGLRNSLESHEAHPFDERNIHPDISAVALNLFDDGHYSQATFEAFKLIDNKVREVSGIQESGYKLMMTAFNESNPKVKLNQLLTASDKDEQIGFRNIFAGLACANPFNRPARSRYSTDATTVSVRSKFTFSRTSLHKQSRWKNVICSPSSFST